MLMITDFCQPNKAQMFLWSFPMFRVDFAMFTRFLAALQHFMQLIQVVAVEFESI